jgi:hypothetical protein
MKPKIALATVAGKPYYLLVNELKKRSVPFLSLTPDDTIPIDVKVIITTKKERPKITHENVLEYRQGENPSEIIDEAIRIMKGKRSYERLVIGIDPGQNFGIAVLEEGKILEARSSTSLSNAVKTLKNILTRMPAKHVTIRIGNGAPSFTKKLLRRLNEGLPENVVIESVREQGTSQFLGDTSHRRGKRDVSSAIKIAQREGRVLPRTKSNA